jgi:hypothetical protein
MVKIFGNAPIIIRILGVGPVTALQRERPNPRRKKGVQLDCVAANVEMAHQHDPFLLSDLCQPVYVLCVMSESNINTGANPIAGLDITIGGNGNELRPSGQHCEVLQRVLLRTANGREKM